MRDSLTRLFLKFRDRHDGRALAKLFNRLAPELLGVAVHLIDDPWTEVRHCNRLGSHADYTCACPRHRSASGPHYRVHSIIAASS